VEVQEEVLMGTEVQEAALIVVEVLMVIKENHLTHLEKNIDSGIKDSFL
jgi:hypothetical protein